MATIKLSTKTNHKSRFKESEFAHDVVFSTLLEKYRNIAGNVVFHYLTNHRGLVIWFSKSIAISN